MGTKMDTVVVDVRLHLSPPSVPACIREMTIWPMKITIRVSQVTVFT